MRQKRRGTYLPDGNGNSYWPFVVAIAAHAVAAALIVLLPAMTVEQKPEQIVTINLTDMPAPPSSGAAGAPPPRIEKKPAEEKPQPQPEPQPQPPKKIEPKTVKEKPPEPVPEVQEPPPPPRVVSLKPQQVVKKVPTPEPPKKDTKAVKRELEKIRQQEIKDAQRRTAEANVQKLQADTDRLMNELEEQKAQSRLMAAREQGLLGSGSKSSNNAASSGVDSALAKQYYARIVGQLQSYWKLPDYKDWPPNLLATVIVTIDKNGKILDVQFEKRSGDDAFDRLVRKTLADADPLPPIPPAMQKERLEFGCNFNPGGATTGR